MTLNPLRHSLLVAAFACSIAQAAPVNQTFDRVLMINPITVCDDGGANCAPNTLYPSFLNSTLLQAQVAPVVLPGTTINSTASLNVNGVADVNRAGNGQSSNALALNAWFVNSLAAAPGSILYGEAYVGGNGIVINSGAVSAAGRTHSHTRLAITWAWNTTILVLAGLRTS